MTENEQASKGLASYICWVKPEHVKVVLEIALCHDGNSIYAIKRRRMYSIKVIYFVISVHLRV